VTGLLAVSGLMTFGGIIFTLVRLMPDNREKSAYWFLDYHSNADFLVPAGPYLLVLGLIGLAISFVMSL
jgi:hypothetical protein